MTLKICVYSEDAITGESIDHPLAPGRELGGFESFRTKFWGAPIMSTLGLSILPWLRSGNVHSDAKELDELEQEAHIILQHVSEISEDTGVGDEHVVRYAENVLHAIGVARQVNGSVYIW